MTPLALPPLDNQWAVVTGSSGGIGRAIALALADSGAHVVVHGRNEARTVATADAIRAKGREAQVVVAELNSSDGRRILIDAAMGRRGIDIWINNAGVDVLTGPTAFEGFAEKLQRLWRVDVEATIELSRAAGHAMQVRGSGCLINIGWDQADQGMAGDSGEMFAAIKGAVMAFTRSLAKSLAPQVRVNCLAPGWIRTAWGEQASADWQQRAAAESLRGRWGTPEDVAQAAVWLASPAADFINGQILPINGGWAG